METGTIINQYKIISAIGKGGMGEVFLAEDTKLKRQVALKILPPEFAEDKDRMTRFVREAQSASALNHPNIITIYEIGESDGTHFIATELIEGETLSKHLKGENVSLKSVLDIATQIASALQTAHSAGIVHRDIKPDNVMIRKDGLAKILDFGIAKLSGRGDAETRGHGEEDKTLIAASPIPRVPASHQTSPGMIIGTANYMSPEQAKGKEVDARTDIFSFGIVFYEMLTGKRAFEGETAMESISSILKDEPKPISQFLPEVPSEIERIVNKTLKKDREERYQTAKDLVVDLKDAMQHLELKNLTERSIVPNKDENKTQILKATTLDEINQTTTNQTVTSNPTKKYLAAGLLTLLLAVGGFFGYKYLSPTTTQINSIAVMPFENKNSDADTEYLSDGLAESVIFRLTQIPDLKVSPTSSVMRYKGASTDVAKIASELGVDAVMTGRLTKRGDNLNITVELVDARTNKSLWGEQYERKLSELLTTQREIVAEIVSKLQLKLSGESEQKLAKKYTDNNEAYQLYLKGNYFTSKLTKEGFLKGNDYFEQAIRLDPNYALAYNGIAFNQLAAMDWFSEPKVAGPKAKNAVEKAVALDADLAETQQLRGMVAHWVEWDWVTAESGFKRAIKLNQNGYRPYGYYSWFLANMGRNEEAIAAAAKGQQLNPVSAEANWYLGMTLLAAGKTEDAIARFQAAIEFDPAYFYAHSFLGRAYLQAGKKQEALTAFKKAHELESDNSENWANLAYGYGATGNKTEAERIIQYLLDKSKTVYVAPYYFALAYAGLDDKEQTFNWLERAYADKSDSLVLYLTADPQMNSIRIDPRYKDLLKRMNLPE